MDTGRRRGAYICDSSREPLKRTHGDTVIGRHPQFAREEEIGVRDFTVYFFKLKQEHCYVI
jgi:hypothetical protein